MTVLEDMDTRSREVFRRIVEAYLATGGPVGSRTLSQVAGLDVSPATIRNTMSDLVEMGLLHAPHISAGRLPTERGLRLFVDGLMEIGGLTVQERRAMETEFGGDTGVTKALDTTATKLSGLTHMASLIITDKADAPLKHIEFVATGPDQALVVLVSAAGDVENRMIRLPVGLPPSALVEAGNYLNARLSGRSLGEARRIIGDEMARERVALDALTAELVREGVALLGGDGANLIIRGRGNLLADAREEDIARVRQLFDDLEQKNQVVDLLDAARKGDGVRIFIGSENQLFSLSGSSVIVAPYRDRDRNIIGAIGVIGPTRLNYAKIIPMVDFTADLVSRHLD